MFYVCTLLDRVKMVIFNNFYVNFWPNWTTKKIKLMCAPVNDDEKCIFNLCSFALKLQLTTTDRIIHDIRNIYQHESIFTILLAYTLRIFVYNALYIPTCLCIYIYNMSRMFVSWHISTRERLNGIGWLYEIYANYFIKCKVWLVCCCRVFYVMFCLRWLGDGFCFHIINKLFGEIFRNK